MIAIDETASVVQGAHHERKAHAAIAVTRDRIGGVREHMLYLLEQLHDACGAGHFHFRELYQAKGAYASLTITQRLSILYAFARLFRTYEIPIWVVQHDPESLAALGDVLPKTLAPRHQAGYGGVPIQWHDPVDVTRLLALSGAVQFMRESKDRFPCVAFMDRLHDTVQDFVPVGRGEDGRLRPSFPDLDPPGVVGDYVARNIFVQLADFAAWSYSRLELLVSRMPFEKDLDRMTFALLRKVLACHKAPLSFGGRWDELWVEPDPPWAPSRFRFESWWGVVNEPPMMFDPPRPLR